MFETQDEINIAISNFTTLKDHPGWKLIEEILDENLKVLREQLENGEEEETKDDIDRIRDKIALTKAFRNTPEEMIKKLQSNETISPMPDPYDTIDQVRKRRKA
jgi:ATP-dependent Lon protease